jgi:hypothetical protein
MARSQRHSKLDTRTARLKLAVRRKPYNGLALSRGVLLLYRRNSGNGAWVLKCADGHGRYWTKAIAEADDFDASNGKTVLTFFEAQAAAKKLASGDDGNSNAPITVEAALADYRTDLITGMANPYNSDWVSLHITNVLKAKPVALLTSKELKHWRDSLLGAMVPSTVNRLCGCLRAALNLAARHDKRIQNREAWEVGLVNLPHAQQARNVILADDEVRAFVAGAYGIDDQFGLFTDVLAITGAGRAAPRRRFARRPGATETDDVEGGQGRQPEARRKETAAVFGAHYHRAGREVEGRSQGPRRRRAVAVADRWHGVGLQSRRGIPSSRQEDRHRHRCRSQDDDVQHAAFERRQNAEAKYSGQAGRQPARHQRPDDRVELLGAHHRKLRRHLAARAAAAREADRQCRGDGAVI